MFPFLSTQEMIMTSFFGEWTLLQGIWRLPFWKIKWNAKWEQDRPHLTQRACTSSGRKPLPSFTYIFFHLNFLKDQLWFQFTFFFFSKATYMATSSNLFQMDLVIEWLIIRSVVSYVVKLRNLQQTGLETCFMVSGRKDNP